MKRKNNLYSKVISIENLKLADSIARKGKTKQYGVVLHDKNKEENILALHKMLKDKTYKTSPYTKFFIYKPKEREIYKLPYFPDRIVHHAAMNILEEMFVSTFTANTFSCIKGKGIHAALDAVKEALTDISNTKHCLKLDVKKFYPNVNHELLKELLRRKIKDVDLLWLLDEIIDSALGLPIGNYLSQSFANFYLTYFDHWIKENMKVKYYFRYADDIVILHQDKQYLHNMLFEIREYFNNNLKLTIKDNYQIFPVAIRGIDFVGYRIYHTHVFLRKRIKQNFARMVKNNKNKASVASYKGWSKWCDSKNLIKKLLNEKI